MWTEGSDDKKATPRTPDGKMPGESRCSPREIQNYLNRVSGSLLDRIDIHVEVPAVKFREITAERMGESSAQIRERVVEARKRQQERFKGKRTITCNEGETNPSLTQTAPGNPDSTNAKYDDT